MTYLIFRTSQRFDSKLDCPYPNANKITITIDDDAKTNGDSYPGLDGFMKSMSAWTTDDSIEAVLRHSMKIIDSCRGVIVRETGLAGCLYSIEIYDDWVE